MRTPILFQLDAYKHGLGRQRILPDQPARLCAVILLSNRVRFNHSISFPIALLLLAVHLIELGAQGEGVRLKCCCILD